ncbi:tetratricopeptide repeat-containing sensor histidine kinase [Carboxylicivirga sp. RSCT41]|uniref:tetratricopeptide repeat-containing sensor histidine kinase n=1 Tax=Carboxylicivirga agarovorans TaxID=3417570 RepID=UPI003D33A1BA
MKELTAIVYENIDSVHALALNHLDDCPFRDLKRKAYYHNFMGEVYYYKQELSHSLQSYQSALVKFQEVGDSAQLAALYNNIGLVHYLKANFDSALVAYNRSLELEKKANNKEGIAMSYQNLGIIYGKWERYNLVYEYYNNALAIYEELEDYSSVAAVTNNLAVISVRINDLDAGFKYYKKAYEAYRNLDKKDGMASVSANLGRLFGLQGQNERAEEYFNEALKIFTELGDHIGLVHTYSMKGEMHLNKGQVDLALSAYEKAAEYNEKVGLREVKSDNLEEIYRAYKSLGKYKQANEVLEQSYALKDSIFDQQQLDKLIELEKKYHNEKSEKELLIASAKVERNHLYMWGLSIFFLLLTIIALIWFNVMKIKERQRRLNMEQKVLRTQMNPHFIFNSLSALQCIILENNQEDAVDFVADFSTLMRLILQYAKQERITLKKEKEILDKYMSLQNRRFDNKINYKIEFEDAIELSSVLVPPMLTQPFLENAIEHGELTKEDSYIHVCLKRNDDKLEFSIEDNGIGIKSSMEKNKVKGKKHASVAMSLTKERLELMNDNDKKQAVTLMVEDLSKYGRKGTRVVFRVPFMTLN